jgi:alpha-L-fucosidase
VASLGAFGKYRRETFGRNLAAGARTAASDTRPGFAPSNLLDGREDTFWAAPDGVLAADATLDLGAPATFNVIRLAEAIRLGQRIDAVAVDTWNAGSWETIATATSIGPRRLIRLERPVTAARLRLRVTQASAPPTVAEFAIFAEPRA